MNAKFERGAGVLCHISSLPNEFGVGSMGKEAYEFADLLKQAHIKYWQVLPLVHTDTDGSPYRTVCCHSGNPYFIDLVQLRDEGLIDDEELQSAQVGEGDVNYDAIYEDRINLLRLAYARFNVKDKAFVKFIESGEFDDYSLFMSLKTRFGGSFDTFPESYKNKEKLAMLEFKRAVYKSDYCFWQFVQFVFRKQWLKLKEYVNSLGIKIIGDLPLYVSYDSSDVWGNFELFKLDEELKPSAVAGIPPEYPSGKGKIWGNPIYDWAKMSERDYSWWRKRVDRALELYDIIKIDYFRGFDSYYEIPADKGVEDGEWKKGPGMSLFRYFTDYPIIADDLGVVSGSATRLIESTGFPGIKDLQFAFDKGADNDNLPSKSQENSVLYTGTHDNDTALGFINKMNEDEFKEFKRKLRAQLKFENAPYPFVTREEAALAMNVCALASKACLAILPVQDITGSDSRDRMNVPYTTDGNWRFRLTTYPTRRQFAIIKKIIDYFDR